MNIENLKMTSPKLLILTANLTIACGVIVILLGLLAKTQPIVANELRIAQGGLVTPVLQHRSTSDNVKKASLEEKSAEFDKNIRERYPNSLIVTVAPGVKHIRLKKICQGRPVMVNVVEVNTKLNPNIEINPQLASTSKLTSKSTIANIAKRNNSIVAINGTYFKPQTGVPLGTLMINKKLYTGPIYNRVAMGFFDSGYDMARIELNASIKTRNAEVKVDNVNQPRMLSTYVLVYTSDWGTNSPATPQYGMQIAVKDGKIVGTSTQSMSIPEGGYVIVGPKTKLEQIMNAKKLNLDIKTITVMVQKEAGQRLCAEVGTRDSGAITVGVNYYGTAKQLFNVSRGNFMPSPNVDSVVIRIDINQNYRLEPNGEKFFF